MTQQGPLFLYGMGSSSSISFAPTTTAVLFEIDLLYPQIPAFIFSLTELGHLRFIQSLRLSKNTVGSLPDKSKGAVQHR